MRITALIAASAAALALAACQPAATDQAEDAAADATAAYLHGLDPDCLDEVVDTRWDPPVTRGVRLVSIIDDASQHAGQAAYVRGLQGL